MLAVFPIGRDLTPTASAELTGEETATVELPDRLVERIEGRLAYTDFDDVDDYVAFVVEEVLAAVADPEDANYDAVDRDEVKRRLESLGYLNE